jgi:hypothetical protein
MVKGITKQVTKHGKNDLISRGTKTKSKQRTITYQGQFSIRIAMRTRRNAIGLMLATSAGPLGV